MFPPQVHILLQFMFRATSYDALKAQVLAKSQANPLVYLTERNLGFNMSAMKTPEIALKQTKLLFNEQFDLALTDAEKKA